MIGAVHDVPVRVRISSALLAKAQAKAQDENMSLSELLRSALRKEVRRSS